CQKSRRCAEHQLGVAEEPPLVEEPACKVAARFGAKQVDAEGQEMLLDDLKLRLHHLEQQMYLLGYLARAPNQAKRRQGRQQQENQRQPPRTIDRENRRDRPRGGIEKGGKQDAGEDDEETRN